MRILIGVAIGIIVIGIIVAISFMTWVNSAVDHHISIRKGTRAFGLWTKPPVQSKIKLYIYNVTNSKEFLNTGATPILKEVGPYVYIETWEKENITFYDNGTVSFSQRKIYIFNKLQSNGTEDDGLVIPNIPMLSATSQSKYSSRVLRLAMASIMEALKVQPFVQVSVKQLLWGYEDPLLKIAKHVPYDKFGLMYNKNGSSPDTVTIFTGINDITKYGLIDKFNGRSNLSLYTSDKCNRLDGSDGSLFPPHMTKNTILHVFDKDLCRKLPLVFEQEIRTNNNVLTYRFTPPRNVFASVEENPENACFCPHGPPCAPSGFFNVSLCQYGSPILISFPHFYLANDSYRTAFNGITPPDPEKHKFYIDVQPMMGASMAAKVRIQINLAVSKVPDIKQVADFPDIIFPIVWVEEGVDSLPDDITHMMHLVTTLPPIAHGLIASVLIIFGLMLLATATWKLVRKRNRSAPLHVVQDQVA